MEYVICNEDGYLDYNGCFGDISEAITFNYFQALSISGATGWDFEERQA